MGHAEATSAPHADRVCDGCGEPYDSTVPADPAAYYADPRAYSDPAFVPHWFVCVSPPGPKKVSAGTRAKVFERDGHRCLACGTTEDLTVDHIKHRSRGGGHGIDNLRTLCRPCNSRRGTGSLPEVDA
jgi:hypothetical protein